MMRRILHDGELSLRPLVARDAGELFLLTDRHRNELRKFMNWVDSTTAISDVTYYILSLDGFWKSGISYGIFEDHRLHGTIGFHHADVRNERTEIGYWLAPPCHGRGLGTRALKLAVEAAFQYTSVYRIEAKIQAPNLSSVRIVEKLGFQLEGVERGGVKFGSEYRDHRVYSLLRSQCKP